MSSPSADITIPCCSPATTESVAVVRDKIADARSDVLIGQGHILKTQGDYTTAIMSDANANTLAINGNTDRGVLASMSQTDKYGLAGLSAATGVSDNVTRTGLAGLQATQSEADRIVAQGSSLAWNQAVLTNAGFAEGRAQVERVNDAQSAYSDRAFKYLQGQNNENFGRLGTQGENGFYRTGQAVAATDKQVVQSEIGLGKAMNAGFSDVGKGISDSYSRLSEQNCQTKETVAAYGNRASDHTATLLATLSGQHTNITRDMSTLGRELTAQAANNFGAVQLEAAKNYSGIQIEASKNTGALQLQAAMNAKESLIENSKWFALAEKTAMVNKCDLEAKMAACCCEIKETVTGTAHATQALIQVGEANRVRDALSAATTENAILRLRREEHHHYPPYHHHGGSRRGSRGS